MGAGESSEAEAVSARRGDVQADEYQYVSRARAAQNRIPVHEARPLHRIVDSHECYVRVLVWDPIRGVLVSGGGDGWIRVWSIQNWGLVAEMDAKLSVRSLLVLPQELASGHSNGEVLIWGMEDESHSLVQRLQAHKEAVYALAFLPSGDLVTGAEDIRVFSRGMLGMFTGFQHALTISEEVLCMCTIPGTTQVATGNMNSLILVWDSSEEWAMRAECHGHQRSVWAICFLRDAKRCCSGSADHSIRVWNPDTWECEHVLKDHTGWVVGLSVGVGTLLSCSIDQGIRVWNSRTWTCERTFTEQEYEVYCVCAFAGGRFATGGAEMAILIYGGPEHETAAPPGGRAFPGMVTESPGGASRRRGRQQPPSSGFHMPRLEEDEQAASRNYPSVLEFARGVSDFPPSSNRSVSFAPGSGTEGLPREGHQQRRAQLMAASELDITMSDFRRQLVEVEKTRSSNNRSRESRGREPQAVKAPEPAPAEDEHVSNRLLNFEKMFDGITGFSKREENDLAELQKSLGGARQRPGQATYPEQGVTTAKFGSSSPRRQRQPSPKPVSKAYLPPEDDILTFETVRAVPTAQDFGLQPDVAQGSDGVTEWSSVLRSSRVPNSDK